MSSPAEKSGTSTAARREVRPETRMMTGTPPNFAGGAGRRLTMEDFLDIPTFRRRGVRIAV
ncbi:MAG: hypothetical protein AB1568_13790 [Thermodesulfobacteriota bacterium]